MRDEDKSVATLLPLMIPWLNLEDMILYEIS